MRQSSARSAWATAAARLLSAVALAAATACTCDTPDQSLCRRVSRCGDGGMDSTCQCLGSGGWCAWRTCADPQTELQCAVECSSLTRYFNAYRHACDAGQTCPEISGCTGSRDGG